MTRSAARARKPWLIDQVLAIVGATADEHMNVWIVRVPVIDHGPVESRSEVALRVLHELAREREGQPSGPRPPERL